MAKSGKHKKLRKQEKAKTQLKGLKKLQKAQNIVNPSLKVKQIVIKEQLTKALEEGTPTTRRRQTVQETLSNFGHHNPNIRKDAIKGLLEIVTNYPSSIHEYLGKIVEKISFVTSDIDSSVRKENLKVAESVFQKVDENNLRPFWTVIINNLKCTLTHISSSVRYDVLFFLELLIQCFPSLTVTSSSIILPCLLNLISSDSNSFGQKGKVKLKVKISNNASSLKERIKVFELICLCLKLRKSVEKTGSSLHLASNRVYGNNLLRRDNRGTTEKPNSSSLSVEPLFSNTCDNVVSSYGDYGPIPTYEILYPYLRETSHLPMSSMFASGSDFDNKSTGEFWFQFVSSCFSCIVATWVEVSTSDHHRECLKKGRSSKSSLKKSFQILGNDLRLTNEIIKMQSKERIPSMYLRSEEVETLKSIANTLLELVLALKNETSSADAAAEAFRFASDEDTVDFVNKLGLDYRMELEKYFLTALPYSCINNADQGELTVANLKLFYVAGLLQLTGKDLIVRLTNFMNELRKSSLTSEQCDLILKFIVCDGRKIQDVSPSVCHEFIYSSLSTKEHRREVCKFLWRLTRLEELDTEEEFLLTSLDFPSLTKKLLHCFSRPSWKLLNLLANVSVRNLADMKPLLVARLPWFKDNLQKSTPENLWTESIRLFYYAGAMHEFKECFEDIVLDHLVSSLDLRPDTFISNDNLTLCQ